MTDEKLAKTARLEAGPRKKPYTRPVLLELGDARDLVQSGRQPGAKRHLCQLERLTQATLLHVYVDESVPGANNPLCLALTIRKGLSIKHCPVREWCDLLGWYRSMTNITGGAKIREGRDHFIVWLDVGLGER